MTTYFCNLQSQSLDLRFISGIGISAAKLDGKADSHSDMTHKKYFPINIEFNYLFNTKKRLNFLIGKGVGFTFNQFFYGMKSLENNSVFEKIDFSQNSVTLPVRIGAEWKLRKLNSLGLQYEIAYNKLISRDLYLKTEDYDQAFDGSLKFSYFIDIRNKNYLSNNLSVYLKTQLKKNTFLYTALGLSIRSESGSFDFDIDQTQTETDSSTGNQVEKKKSLKIEKAIIKHNLIYCNIGLEKNYTTAPNK